MPKSKSKKPMQGYATGGAVNPKKARRGGDTKTASSQQNKKVMGRYAHGGSLLRPTNMTQTTGRGLGAAIRGGKFSV